MEAGGSHPTPRSDPDAVVDEEWPVWHDGRTFPGYPGGDATVQVWQRFKQRTVAYMTDKDAESSTAQCDQINTRIDRANTAIERLLPATPPVPETGGSSIDLGPTDLDQWTEPDTDLGPSTGVCPEWVDISFPVAPRNMTASSRKKTFCYINNLRMYRGQAGITQIELNDVDDWLEEALILRSGAPP